jgi:hypothetical protein
VTGDERRQVRRQEQDHPGLVLGQAHPPDRHPLRPLRLLFGGKPLRVGHLQRFGDVGPDRIDPDAVAADLDREAAGELDDRGLEGGVNRILRIAAQTFDGR